MSLRTFLRSYDRPAVIPCELIGVRSISFLKCAFNTRDALRLLRSFLPADTISRCWTRGRPSPGKLVIEVAQKHLDKPPVVDAVYACRNHLCFGRYLAAQWVGMLEEDAWLMHAAHANSMARYLEARISALQNQSPHLIKLMFPVQANSVFVMRHPDLRKELRFLGWEIYTFIGGSARLMCSWSTQIEDVDHLCAALQSLIAVEDLPPGPFLLDI